MLVPPEPDLRTLDIRLRRFEVADIPAFSDFMTKPENTRFMTFPEEAKNRQAAASILRQSIASYDKPDPSLALAACRSDDPTALGGCGAFCRSAEEIEIFCLVFEEYRKQGIAGKCAKALTEHLRATQPGSDLIAFVDPRNEASKTVLKRLGYVDRGSMTSGGHVGRKYVLPTVGGASDESRS